MWITGQVFDETGRHLAGVSIELIGAALLGTVRKAVTDAEGRYVLLDLRPGTYSLHFSCEGFRTVVREGVIFAESLVSTVCAQLPSSRR